jgi:hypothetical protein
MANEGKVIGDADHFGPSTWGALRSVIYNLSSPVTPYVEAYPHNVHFIHGFKTTEGNGFIRTDYSALFSNAATPYYGPNFNIYASGLVPPLLHAEFGSEYQTSTNGMIVKEDRDQLVGETVNYSGGGGGSITITAQAFIYPHYQMFTWTASPPAPGPEPITSIGKLTAF